MTVVCGIDPGAKGALAVYDDVHNTLEIDDMPIWYQTTGKRKRPRIDPIGIRDFFERLALFGVDLVVLEAVGGRPKQSASHAYVFGYGVGLVAQQIVASRLPLETTPPNVWKRLMRVPLDDAGIAAAFDLRFPKWGDLIRGRGRTKETHSIKDGRAEAALLAMFGAKHIQPKISKDPEGRLVYDRARIETGA